MDAPVSTFAAQIHQESAWRPGAVSAVGAQGMAQFMPATSSWIAGLSPRWRRTPLSIRPGAARPRDVRPLSLRPYPCA
ncbi:lytic transglycosylase domain-containing protein [Achromobacter xylosoxidans]